jgi:predicted transcriptional regulator
MSNRGNGGATFGSASSKLPADRGTALAICEAEVGIKGRVVGLRMALLTLRVMEHWRQHLGVGYEEAMIVLATAAITMEKFTRSEFEPELENIRNAVPPAQLARCNVASIAVAVGLNRETARRKVNRLVENGMLLRDRDGSLRLSPEYTLSVPTSDMMQRQMETLVHTANELVRDGILQAAST